MLGKGLLILAFLNEMATITCLISIMLQLNRLHFIAYALKVVDGFSRIYTGVIATSE